MESDKTLSEKLKNESKNVFKLMEKEFLLLKFKAAKCAKTCFEEKNIPESFACEKTCMNSIRSAANVMKIQQAGIEKKLNLCIQTAKDGRAGFNAKIKEAYEGPISCYEEYLTNLNVLKDQMVIEFSFYV